MNVEAAFDALGVPQSCSPRELRQAFQRQALRHHPDRNNSRNANARMSEINNAYKIAKEHLESGATPSPNPNPERRPPPPRARRQNTQRPRQQTTYTSSSVHINGMNVQVQGGRVYVNGRLERDYNQPGADTPLRVGPGQTLVLDHNHVGPVSIDGGTLHVTASLVGDVTVHNGQLIIDGGAFVGDVYLHGASFFRLSSGCHVGAQVTR